MFYECESCGAHLDAGERCDCENNKKAAPEGNGSTITNTVYHENIIAVKLMSLSLANFQGIRKLTLEFNGKGTRIYGDNATGKTTIFNAITWLLVDKASTGAKNFTPKTKGSDGGDLHNLEHSAEAVFSVDGRIITLKKTFHEVYKKKRGSVSDEFDGHTVDYYVDGVPVKEKEYTSVVESLCGGIERIKMLTMPDYFAEVMTWDARRNILLEMCGDISELDIIASTPALAKLPAYLTMPGTTQMYTVEEYKKIATAEKSAINRELQAIPGRIDEAQMAMPDIGGIDEGILKNELVSLSKHIDELREKRASVASGDTSAARQALAEAELTMTQAKSAYAMRNVDDNAKVNADIMAARRQEASVTKRLAEKKQELEDAQTYLVRMVTMREKLLEEYMNVAMEAWDSSKAMCPTCKRELPEADIDIMKATFNTLRSSRLESINAKGNIECSADMISAQNTLIDGMTSELTVMEAERGIIKAHIAELEKHIIQAAPFENTPEYAELENNLRCKHNELNDARNSNQNTFNAIDADIARANEALMSAQRAISRIEYSKAQQNRIAELEAREKELAASFEELEHGMFLCDMFVKAKVAMLTGRINDKFNNVRFRLFVEQINGGVKEDCEVMIPAENGGLVPFAFANNAARINAGLEIIQALSGYFCVAMPVCIDNAESVTHIEEIDAQVIRLVVSESDKNLRLDIVP